MKDRECGLNTNRLSVATAITIMKWRSYKPIRAFFYYENIIIVSLGAYLSTIEDKKESIKFVYY